MSSGPDDPWTPPEIDPTRSSLERTQASLRASVPRRGSITKRYLTRLQRHLTDVDKRLTRVAQYYYANPPTFSEEVRFISEEAEWSYLAIQHDVRAATLLVDAAGEQLAAKLLQLAAEAEKVYGAEEEGLVKALMDIEYLIDMLEDPPAGQDVVALGMQRNKQAAIAANRLRKFAQEFHAFLETVLYVISYVGRRLAS